MRTVTIAWDPQAHRFVAEGTHAGRQIVINAPHSIEEVGGPTGFSATELLLAGAGACAAWDVLEILRKKRQPLDAMDVTVESEQAPDPPWTYRHVALHFRVQGPELHLSVIQRVIRLSVVRYCSVISTIRGVAEIGATIELLGSDGTGGGRQPVDVSVAAEPATLDPSEPLTEDE